MPRLEYGDFYDIAAYGNENWKGGYTPKEVAQNAYDYYSDFKASKENGIVMHSISKLIELLAEDESEDANHISDIVVCHNDKGKRNDVKQDLALFDKALKTKYHKRQIYKRIEPHRVKRLHHGV